MFQSLSMRKNLIARSKLNAVTSGSNSLIGAFLLTFLSVNLCTRMFFTSRKEILPASYFLLEGKLYKDK